MPEDQIVAEREYEYTDEVGHVHTVLVCIMKPERVPPKLPNEAECWRVAYTISAPINSGFKVYGVDSMQALQLAFWAIRADLQSARWKGRLRLYGRKSLGLGQSAFGFSKRRA